MTFKEKLLQFVKSRKTWVLVASVVAAASGLAVGQIDFWQFLQALIAAGAIYTGSVAYEDAAALRRS